MSAADDPTLARLRAEVAALDGAIVAAVNRRLELVREIRGHKDRIGVPFVDRAQEDSNLQRLQDANPGPLSPDGLRELYTTLLEVIKRET